MTQQHTPGELSFSGIPLQPWAQALQQLGLAALAFHLDHGKPLALPQILNTGLLKRLEQPSIIGGQRRWYRLRSAFAKMAGLSQPKVSLPKAKQRQRAMQAWLQKSRWQIASALHGLPGQGLPTVFWPVAAEMAWRDPNFRYKAGLAVQEYLRTRVLWLDGEPPMADFSPRVIWGLILLTPAERPALGKLGSSATWRRWHLMRRLRRIATEAFQDHGWAQHWDIWLLREVYRKNRQPWFGWPGWLKLSMAILPGKPPGYEEPQKQANQLNLRQFFARLRVIAGAAPRPIPIEANKWRRKVPAPLQPYFSAQSIKTGGNR